MNDAKLMRAAAQVLGHTDFVLVDDKAALNQPDPEAPENLLLADEATQTAIAELAAALPDEAAPAPLSRQKVAAVRLTIGGGDIAGIEQSEKLAVAYMMGEQRACIYFEEVQPDLAYIVTPSDGVEKFDDRIEVETGGAGSLCLLVERVQ